MSRKPTKKLTWQPGTDNRTGRWRKKYKGKVYYFPGGRGKHDRQAYDAALKAWEKLKVEIDEESQNPLLEEYDQTIAEWEDVRAASMLHGDEETAEHAEEKLALLRENRAKKRPPSINPEDTFAGYLEKHVVGNLNIKSIYQSSSGRTRIHTLEFPTDLLTKSPGDGNASEPLQTTAMRHAVLMDRLEGVRRSAPPPGETLEDYIEIFLTQKQKEVDAKQLSMGRLNSIRVHLSHFENFVGKRESINSIESKTLRDYHLDLLKQIEDEVWKPKTASEHLSTVKSFVRWLAESEAIGVLPKILQGNSQALTIRTGPSEIVVYTKEEIATLLTQASDRTKLYILLMLNCGMTQKDVADLLLSEIDWEKGYIERKRSKTRTHENVPTVKYRLWPETLRLLKQEQNQAKTGLALRNEKGATLYFEGIGPDGKYSKNDNIRNAFERLRKKAKISKSLKMFRKTSASLIGKHRDYNDLADLFLGHSPRTVAERHYTVAPQDRLNQAVAWLGEEYGVVQKASSKSK